MGLGSFSGAGGRTRRVYFLGAGASKSFFPRLPLARDLNLQSLFDPNEYKDFEVPSGAISQVRAFLQRTKRSDEVLTLPIEGVLTDLRPDTPPEYPYENVSFCLFSRLHLPEDAPSALVTWLKGVRSERATIITTNYDTVVEWVLANIGTGELPLGGNDFIDRDALHWLDYGIPPARCKERKDSRKWPTRPESSILFLKLHGSVSWSFCKACGMYSIGEIYERAAEHALAGFGECSNCVPAKTLRPVVIPMTLQKEISDFAIQAIWERAERVLGSADEIVFAGFSLNPADNHIRDLLYKGHRAAGTSRVTVVDPSGESAERYKAIYGKVVATRLESWEDYVLELCPN